MTIVAQVCRPIDLSPVNIIANWEASNTYIEGIQIRELIAVTSFSRGVHILLSTHTPDMTLASPLTVLDTSD